MKKITKLFTKTAAVLCMLILTTTTVFAGTVTETTQADFSTGTHDNSQAVNWWGGEIILDYVTSTIESALSTINNSVWYDIRPRIAIDKNGILYATWHEDDGDFTRNDIFFSRSEDGGITWAAPIQIDIGDLECPEFPANSILPDIIIDDSTSQTKIYIAWVDDRANFFCGPGQIYNVWFTGSLDGLTWSQDVMVNNFPSLSGWGTLLGNPDYEQQEYFREYPTGGPRLALGPAPDYDILITWMNDEVWPIEYDIYYSKSSANHPDYIFDADWTTPCEPMAPPLKFFELPGCEDAKIDDNLSDWMIFPGMYSGVPSIDTRNETVSVVYEDDRIGWYPMTEIFNVTFPEYGIAASPFPLVGIDLIPWITVPPYLPPAYLSTKVDDDMAFTSREPDVDIDIENNILVVWDDNTLTGIDNFILFDKSTNGGLTFGTDIIVNDPHLDSSNAYFANIDSNPNDADKIYVTYDDEFSSTTGVYFDKSTNGGSTWGTDVRIVGADGTIEAVHSDVEYSDKTEALFVLWGDYDWTDTRGDGTTDYDPYSSRSLNWGASWAHYYVTSNANTGYTSQAIDLGGNGDFDGQQLSWSEDLSEGGDIQLQLRTSDTQVGLAGENFVGPNGNIGAYYTNKNGTNIHTGHNGDQWIQYFIQLISDTNRTATPILENVTIAYNIGADVECETNADCAEGEICQDNVCVDDGSGGTDECETNADCAEGEICQDGACIDDGTGGTDECETNTDCAEGEICQDGACIDDGTGGTGGECQTNADCSEEEVCQDGTCTDLGSGQSGCTNDSDCGENEICTSGGYCGPQDSCGGFPDVSSYDPLCPAIQFVKDNEIFSGYPDGTFQPFKVINRAETGKVILEAFMYQVLPDDGTNLGYSDTIIGEWYMPHLRTAQLFEIITGYPDRSVKPAQTVNKVELLKMFFKAAPVTLAACTSAPYPDTQITDSTSWYMPFVCYAKLNELMNADSNGNFNPSDGMLRGNVAELFYRYDKRIGEY